MKKNNFVKTFSAAIFASVLLLASCGTTGKLSSSGQDSEKRVEQVVSDIKNVKGNHGDVWFENFPEKVEKTYSASNFYAANALLAMDDYFEFSKNLTDAQLIALARALFKDLPYESPLFGDHTYARAAVVSGYYEDGTNLLIIINRVTLKKDYLSGQKYGYVILTNAFNFKVNNKETGKATLLNSQSFNYNTNYGIFLIPYADGKLVKESWLNRGEENYSPDLSYAEKGNLMDAFIKDEIDENDELVEKIFNEIKTSDAGALVKNFLAPLNYGLYLTKLGKYDEAEALWNSLDKNEVFSFAESEEAKASIEKVFSHDVVFLLKIMRQL